MVRSSSDRLPQGDSMTSRKEHIRNIEKAIEKLKRDNKKVGRRVTSVTPIERILNVYNVRILGWVINDSTPGGTVNYQLGIYNSGPDQALGLYAHVWIGLRFVHPTNGTFLLNDVDTRFPRLTGPYRDGLMVNPGSSEDIFFTLDIPSTVERTSYCLNTCLFTQGPVYGDLTVLDRATWLINIT